MKHSARIGALSFSLLITVVMALHLPRAEAQEASTSEQEVPLAAAQADESEGVSVYVAAGLSISNTGDANFGETTYPSLELGLGWGPGSLGLVVGRASNDFSGSEELRNYWWELKVALSIPIGDFSAYGLFGIGNYLSTARFFIEYGVGISYSWDPLSLFVQASNWDGVWYVTPGLAYTF